MFHISTQRKYWTFKDEQELVLLRTEANEKCIDSIAGNMTDEERSRHFLTAQEERLLCRHFEFVMKEFCGKFQPPMPKCVVGTAINFMKRFYVNNSVMDYHPRDIMLTCVYLACKVEEFYVPIGQFVGNLKGNREKFADIVLGFELLLMQRLHYHLTIHNMYRPLEGLFIDLKTRYPQMGDPEKLRRYAEDFIDKSLGTDVSLLFAPSQVALAALLSSASREQIIMDSYVTEVLLAGASQEELRKTITLIKKIKMIVKNQDTLQRDVVQLIQRKLEKCRNQENNPESEVYKRKMEEMFEDEDEMRSQKRARIDEETRVADSELLG
ncbi:cyclin-H-like [Haliotis cracherodii]|uniref:cyclin-H-like n=1 Tax=Haliotis cracherodii TaxID=6455 RepID=UPI0039EBE4D2